MQSGKNIILWYSVGFLYAITCFCIITHRFAIAKCLTDKQKNQDKKDTVKIEKT